MEDCTMLTLVSVLLGLSGLVLLIAGHPAGCFMPLIGALVFIRGVRRRNERYLEQIASRK